MQLEDYKDQTTETDICNQAGHYLPSSEITNMSGKITCYLDCGMSNRCLCIELQLTSEVSPYSYFALLYLEKNRDALATHNVDIE